MPVYLQSSNPESYIPQISEPHTHDSSYKYFLFLSSKSPTSQCMFPVLKNRAFPVKSSPMRLPSPVPKISLRVSKILHSEVPHTQSFQIPKNPGPGRQHPKNLNAFMPSDPGLLSSGLVRPRQANSCSVVQFSVYLATIFCWSRVGLITWRPLVSGTTA